MKNKNKKIATNLKNVCRQTTNTGFRQCHILVKNTTIWNTYIKKVSLLNIMLIRQKLRYQMCIFRLAVSNACLSWSFVKHTFYYFSKWTSSQLHLFCRVFSFLKVAIFLQNTTWIIFSSIFSFISFIVSVLVVPISSPRFMQSR